jgi:hypothetical protein
MYISLVSRSTPTGPVLNAPELVLASQLTSIASESTNNRKIMTVRNGLKMNIV